ncbi:hypothetical protein Tco_0857546 [Tanacetum coccineum]|uniref:Uncharacterized protein n=1 Tax=Tanacetum coccineum TaxID=301880 RepID=A0ABQ5B8F9_9ASTR
MTESPLIDSNFVVPVFSPGDDPIACLNKAIDFLTVVASSRGDNVKVILVLGIRVMLLALRETMQADRVSRRSIPNNAAFATRYLDTYDSDCNDISNTNAILMANIFNYGYDVILETRVHTKEQSDSLVHKLNLECAKNEDLKAQIQDKVFVITSLKNDLRKLNGKEIVDIAAQTPSSYTIVPSMFKLDIEPLAHRLLQNREAHIDYLKYTQEQVDILRGIVEQDKAKQPLDKELDFAFYIPTPPQIFEIGKCSVKMYLKHHEGQIRDILNYLAELYLHHIEKMEEGRINRMIIRRNSDKLKTELKKIHTQIIKLQKKQLGQKDKIAFAHYGISDLEQIIEKIQARHQTNQEDF